MSPALFKPSQVALSVPPLIDTMRRGELEHAAALIVVACHHHGDAWKAVTWAQVQEALRAAVDAKQEPITSLLRNPFFRPDAGDLAKSEFARWVDEATGSLELTEAGLTAIAKWVRLPELAPADPVPEDLGFRGRRVDLEREKRKGGQ